MTDDDRQELKQNRRDRWATPIAAAAVVIHGLAGLFVLAWHYFIAPRWKFEIAEVGVEISQSAMFLVQQSDLIVNYWYVIVPVGLVFLALDYFLMEWLAREVGLSAAILGAIVIAIVILSHVAYAQVVYRQEMAKLRQLMSVQAPSPAAQ